MRSRNSSQLGGSGCRGWSWAAILRGDHPPTPTGGVAAEPGVAGQHDGTERRSSLGSTQTTAVQLAGVPRQSVVQTVVAPGDPLQLQPQELPLQPLRGAAS